MMSRRKIAASLAVLALGAVGVASAFADTKPPTPVVAPSDAQNGQEGVDEQGAANDVAEAADDVQAEVENETGDDESGDQQGQNDQSEEAGDNDQGDSSDGGGPDADD